LRSSCYQIKRQNICYKVKCKRATAVVGLHGIIGDVKEKIKNSFVLMLGKMIYKSVGTFEFACIIRRNIKCTGIFINYYC